MIDPERLFYIRWLVARFLLYQERLSPVIDVRELQLPQQVYFSSFTAFSGITGIAPDVLNGGGLLNDGYTIRKKGSCIVLYNENYDIVCPQRLRFSLAHELGHIFLHHADDNAVSEEEANVFASQTVAHDAIVLPMLCGKWNTDLECVREQFGVSWHAAEIKLRCLNRNPAAYSDAERLLCRKYYADCRPVVDAGQKFAVAHSAAYIAFDG